MKRKIILAAVAAALSLFSIHAQAEADPNFYIYLCIGQSNMEGQGTIEDCDLAPDARFQMMSTLDCGTRKQGEWYRAVPPLARCDTRLCPADYFGRTMVANLDEGKRVGVVVVAIGGIKIDLYDPDGWQSYVNSMTESWQISAVNAYGGNPLARLLECAKEAQKSGVIKGILLHQGESDAYSDAWIQKVKKVYENLLSELNLNAADVPLIAGEVGGEDQNGGCAHANPVINRLPKTIPTAHVVSSVGCTLQSDNIHFDSQGYRKLGRRYAKEALSVLGIDADIDEDEVPEVDVTEPVDITNRFTYCWSNSENVTTGSDGTLIYNAAQWGGLACWLGGADWSAYSKIVFEFAEPATVETKIVVMAGAGNISSSASAGANNVELSFDGNDVTNVSQVALQTSNSATVKISRIYLMRKATTAISTAKAENLSDDNLPAYNLAGQPVPGTATPGIVISKKRKVLKK